MYVFGVKYKMWITSVDHNVKKKKDEKKNTKWEGVSKIFIVAYIHQ